MPGFCTDEDERADQRLLPIFALFLMQAQAHGCSRYSPAQVRAPAPRPLAAACRPRGPSSHGLAAAHTCRQASPCRPSGMHALPWPTPHRPQPPPPPRRQVRSGPHPVALATSHSDMHRPSHGASGWFSGQDGLKPETTMVSCSCSRSRRRTWRIQPHPRRPSHAVHLGPGLRCCWQGICSIGPACGGCPAPADGTAGLYCLAVLPVPCFVLLSWQTCPAQHSMPRFN